jgi:DNA-binding Lrp family transcriptional regulator
MEITGLDQTDNRIIELLKDNARLSYSEIGKIVGLSRVTVKRRIEQIEKSGILLRRNFILFLLGKIFGILRSF